MAESLLDFTSIDSPRGSEYEAGELMHRRLAEYDLNPRRQTVFEDRNNIIGTLEGEKSGTTLVFNGHLDTAYGNPDEDSCLLSNRKRVHIDAWRDGEHLIGDTWSTTRDR